MGWEMRVKMGFPVANLNGVKMRSEKRKNEENTGKDGKKGQTEDRVISPFT